MVIPRYMGTLYFHLLEMPDKTRISPNPVILSITTVANTALLLYKYLKRKEEKSKCLR